MPNYKTHIVVGFLLVFAFLLANYYLNIIPFKPTKPTDFILVGLIPLIYSILPDIDINSSKIFGVTITLALILMLISIFTGRILLVVAIIIALLVILALSHRGITHSLLGAVIMIIPLILLFHWFFVLVGLIAYLSHILVDGEFSLT